MKSEFPIISNVLRNLFKIDMHWSSLTILMMHSVKRQEFEEEYWRLLKVLKLCEYSELSPRKLWHLLWRNSPGGATVAINCEQTMPTFLWKCQFLVQNPMMYEPKYFILLKKRETLMHLSSAYIINHEVINCEMLSSTMLSGKEKSKKWQNWEIYGR